MIIIATIIITVIPNQWAPTVTIEHEKPWTEASQHSFKQDAKDSMMLKRPSWRF